MSGHQHAGNLSRGQKTAKQTLGERELQIDPVCGMKVDPATSNHRYEHEGRIFHFCSAGCRTKFAAEPTTYLARKSKSPNSASSKGLIYTCPMHPQIRQEGPGNCPICGMALEPLEVAAEAGPNPELADMTRRFCIGLAVTVPIVVLENGRPCSGAWSARSDFPTALGVGAIRAGDSGRAMGGVAVSSAPLYPSSAAT